MLDQIVIKTSPLLRPTAGRLLDAEASFYTRFEDGECLRVASWPQSDERVQGWIAQSFIEWVTSSDRHEHDCRENVVIPLDLLPKGGGGDGYSVIS